MTMPSSGPISIGQARNECEQGNPINARNFALSELAGVAPGQRYAWSYWYGKTYLRPLNNVLFSQYGAWVDRNFFIDINFRTGTYGVSFNGNNNPHLTHYTQVYSPVANISAYTGWSIAITYSGRQEAYVTQHPSPGNDFTGQVYINDNDVSGAGGYSVNVYLTCTR